MPSPAGVFNARGTRLTCRGSSRKSRENSVTSGPVCNARWATLIWSGTRPDLLLEDGSGRRWGNVRGDEEAQVRRSGVEFETIRAEKINFGRNNFLEVARKRAKTADGSNEFISVSRGYYLPDGTERFKRSLTIPDDPEIKAFVAENIRSL